MSSSFLSAAQLAAQKELEGLIASAIGAKAKSFDGILPKGCSWQCWVEIGPDGKPAVKCGIKCD